jgi:hypothetical protein
LVHINRWWAPSKFDPVKSPMLFFKKGQPVIPPLRPDQGLDMVLEHMVISFLSIPLYRNLEVGTLKLLSISLN